VKILLLQLKRIGDLILTTPAIAALRERFPEAQLTLVVSNECAELLPAISNIERILIARRNLRDLSLFLLRRLHTERSLGVSGAFVRRAQTRGVLPRK